jgi:hypothetical protein
VANNAPSVATTSMQYMYSDMFLSKQSMFIKWQWTVIIANLLTIHISSMVSFLHSFGSI